MSAAIDRRAVLAGAIAGTVLPGWLSAAAHVPPMPNPRLWDPPLPFGEGFAPGPNGRVHWRLYPGGGPGATPAIVLHGGPASGHRYMRPYAALASRRPVLFYDQSGCGRSAAPADLSRYTAARYVDELEAVRSHIGWERAILVGHSWGAFLGPLYAARYPGRVAALVLAGGASRWRDFQIASERWLAELGAAAIATVRRAEAIGHAGGPAYAGVLKRYYARHLCRLRPIPRWFEAEGRRLSANPVYRALNGPSEFQMTGRFADLDPRPILPHLAVPALVTCGAFDEGPPWVARIAAASIPGARLRIFDGLSHMSHIEDPAAVTAATAAFLDGQA